MNPVSISVEEHPKLDLAAFVLQHATPPEGQDDVFQLLSLEPDAIEKSPLKSTPTPNVTKQSNLPFAIYFATVATNQLAAANQLPNTSSKRSAMVSWDQSIRSSTP